MEGRLRRSRFEKAKARGVGRNEKIASFDFPALRQNTSSFGKVGEKWARKGRENEAVAPSDPCLPEVRTFAF